MPTIVTASPTKSLPLEPPRKLWTREECEALERTGLFVNEHLELIEGELINKMGKKRSHITGLQALMEWLLGIFGPRSVMPESTIDVSPCDNPTSEPEPDLVVVKGSYRQYRTANPRPENIALVVEISDTTLNFDRTVKAGLYARAAIAEYWILDVIGRRLLVHRDPESGVYRSVIAYNEGESVAPLAAQHAHLSIADLFAD